MTTMQRADSHDELPLGHPASVAAPTRPTMLSISSAYPPFEITQQDSWEHFFKRISPSVPFAKRIVESTRVKKRHIMWDLNALPEVCAMLTGDRMASHAEATMDVASRSLKQAIGDFDTRRIGSLVMACSTGYVNP